MAKNRNRSEALWETEKDTLRAYRELPLWEPSPCTLLAARFGKQPGEISAMLWPNLSDRPTIGGYDPETEPALDDLHGRLMGIVNRLDTSSDAGYPAASLRTQAADLVVRFYGGSCPTTLEESLVLGYSIVRMQQ